MKTTNYKTGSSRDAKYVNDNLNKKMKDSKSKSIPFISDVKKLYKMMKDPDVGMGFKSLAVGALAYFILPLDAVPDAIPILGFIDDAGVVTAAVSYLKSQIKGYDK